MMTLDPVTPDLPLRQLVDDYIYGHHFRMLPVVEGDRMLGCVTLQYVREIPRARWRRRSVRELLRPASPDNSFSIDSDSALVLSRISRLGGPGK